MPRMTPDEIMTFLAGPVICRLGCLDDDGHPYVVPCWIHHADGGFYIVGMKSYGRAPTFLLATGYEQARSVAAALAGDREAAERLELELPETGVCSSQLVEAAPETPGPQAVCCAGGAA